MNHLIELNHIHKTYNPGKPNQYEALRGINVTIEKGEFVAIMGPSGSGKSTLMHIIGALDTATSGEYIINGKQIQDFSSNELAQVRNQEIGFVFQSFNLLPKYSLLENVLMPTLYGPKKDYTSRGVELLQKVGLGEKIHSKTNQISGGQIQRTAIARSLILNPSIILADEPTGNLDTKTSNEIMEMFQKLNKEGITVILVTHEDSIAAYAKRIITIKDGKIHQDTKATKKQLTLTKKP
jgi:putative ABC transport system ATP-binding protein